MSRSFSRRNSSSPSSFESLQDQLSECISLSQGTVASEMGCCCSNDEDGGGKTPLLKGGFDKLAAGLSGLSGHDAHDRTDNAEYKHPEEIIEEAPPPKKKEKNVKKIQQSFDKCAFTFSKTFDRGAITHCHETNPELNLLTRECHDHESHRSFHVNKRDKHLYPNDGDTIVHTCVRKEDMRLLWWALSSGVDIDIPNAHTGDTALVMLINGMKPPATKTDLRIIAILLDFGANAQKENKRGQNAVNLVLDENLTRISQLFETHSLQRSGGHFGDDHEIIEAKRIAEMKLIEYVINPYYKRPHLEENMSIWVQYHDNNPYGDAFKEWKDVSLVLKDEHLFWTKAGPVIKYDPTNETFFPNKSGGVINVLGIDTVQIVSELLLVVKRDGKHNEQSEYVFRFDNEKTCRKWRTEIIINKRYYFDITAKEKSKK